MTSIILKTEVAKTTKRLKITTGIHLQTAMLALKKVTKEITSSQKILRASIALQNKNKIPKSHLPFQDFLCGKVKMKQNFRVLKYDASFTTKIIDDVPSVEHATKIVDVSRFPIIREIFWEKI